MISDCPILAPPAIVRVAVALPTGGLLVGCVLGVFWPDASSSFFVTLLIASAVLAVGAFCAGHRSLFAAGLVLSFAAGGTLLAVRQWQDAWRPTLKIAFESMARDERQELVKAGRFVPEEDSAAVVVVGVLQSDASPTAGGGISLNVATRWIGRIRSANERTDPAANPVSGGVLLTVVGALAADRMSEWRAGRTIRAPAQVRAPSFYLDPGVPDQRRVLARRGDRPRRYGEKWSPRGGRGARQPTLRVRRVDSCVLAKGDRFGSRRLEYARRGHRDGDRDWRQKWPRRFSRTATAGGRHLPRHRDIGREHRHPGRSDARRLSNGRVARPWRDVHGNGRSCRLWLSRRRGSVGRSRDDDGGRLPGWACA